MNDVTRILIGHRERRPAGGRAAPASDLRRSARAGRGEDGPHKPGQTLQATPLVHQAYLRLGGGGIRAATCQVRPTVILMTVPLAMFGAIVGLWIYDMNLDVFAQIGLVMLIGLETKNAILIVEFGVELREKHGRNIIDSAKEASRQRLRPILMTSWSGPPAPGTTAATRRAW